MDFSSILEHMNQHHQAELIDLCKKFGNTKEVKNAKLVGVDFDGLDIDFNEEKLRIEFPQRANAGTIKNAIIELCQSVSKTLKYEDVKKEILSFKQSFGSILLSTISPSGLPTISYAPLIQLDEKNYIYISATAEHFENIKTHPDKIEIMFLEDECKAKSIILRKRLKYRAKAEFITRENPIFTKALDWLEDSMGGSGGIKTIRNFNDFYLIELTFLNGRFVKGFGQAYLITDTGEVQHIGITGNPHNANPHNSHLKS